MCAEIRPQRSSNTRQDISAGCKCVSACNFLWADSEGTVWDFYYEGLAVDSMSIFDELAYPSEYNPMQNISLLTAEERDVIGAYTLGDYALINEALRGHRPMTDPVSHDAVVLRGALAKFPLESAFRVSREVSSADLGLSPGEDPERLIGDELLEAGFMSTSGFRVPPKILERVEPIWLDLALPEGIPALMLGEELTLATANEREMLVVDARAILPVAVGWNSEHQVWIVSAQVE